MDVTGPLTVQFPRPRFPTAPIRILIFSVWLAGCTSTASTPSVPALSQKFAELKQRIVQIRGLSFKREVALDSRSLNSTATTPEEAFADDYGDQAAAQLARVYNRLGLLPQSADFAAALADYARLQRIAAYDARRELIVVAPEATRLGRALAGETAPAPEQIPLALALTQALQEQHFHWQEKLKLVSLEDRKLAFRAVASGDAILLALIHLQGANPAPKWEEQAPAIGRLATELEKMASGLPEVLRHKLVFPFREGSQFVRWAYAAKGWDGVNALFANPPVSASQILHPEKYYLKPENPLAIVPWSLIRQMKERASGDQTLGEGLIQSLLASRYSRKEAEQIASGWAGDHLSAYQEGENLITAWISAWSNEKKAAEFLHAYRTVLERHHRMRFNPSVDRNDGLQAELSGGRWLLLQIKGAVVLLLDGAALPRALGLAEEIWKDLEIGAESTIIPFDSAKAALQLSRSSR